MASFKRKSVITKSKSKLENENKAEEKKEEGKVKEE